MKSTLPLARLLALLLVLVSTLGPGLPAAQADDGPPPTAVPTETPSGLPALPEGGPFNAVPAPVPTGCQSFIGAITNNSAQAINDSATITSTINVPASFNYVWEVAVGTLITHTFPGDLDIHLISPAGTDILLSGNLAGNHANVFSGTLWSDQAALIGGTGLAVTDQVFTTGVLAQFLSPQEPLGALRGQNPNGNWKLVVHDGTGGDQGKLLGWSLWLSLLKHAPDVTSLAFQTRTTPVAIPDAGEISTGFSFAGLPDPIMGITFSTVITHAKPGTLDVFLAAPDNTKITLSSNNGDSQANVLAGTTWDDRADQLAPPGLVTTHAYAAGVPASPLAPEEPLSEMLGASANGSWLVHVADSTSDGNSGTLGRLTMAIQTAHCFPDLQAGISTVPDYPRLGQAATFTLTSYNYSVTATNVSLHTTLDPRLRFQAAAGAGWACSGPPVNAAGGPINCTRPSQGQNATTNVAVTVTMPLAPAEVPISVTLGLAGADTNPGNNSTNSVLAALAHSENQNPWDIDASTGYVEEGGQDAFDEWGLLRVAVFSGATQLADANPDGFGLLFAGPGQRWTTRVPQTVAGIQISRQLYAPANQNWLRYVDTFHNTSGGARNLLVAWGGNLGSDDNTYPAASSSGDLVITANDDWAVTQQDPPPGPAGDAPVAYALRSPTNTSYLGPVIFNDSLITTTWPVTGEQELGHLYSFSLAPGASKRLAYFVFRGLAEATPGPDDCTYYGGCVIPVAGSQVTQASNTIAGLVSNPALCDLTPTERATLVNWNAPLATCHDAFLPIITR